MTGPLRCLILAVAMAFPCAAQQEAKPARPEKEQPEAKAGALRVERERAEFKKLIAENPNYFGNLPQSQFKAVKSMTANKTYEEVTCVGYNADRSQLEATVQVKRPAGYGGDLCGDGTIEYVRFFLDYGSGWED